MKATLDDFYKVLQEWAEENELTDFDENDAGALLEALDNAHITVLPKKSIAELRVAAREGYKWPAPFGFPATTPTAECEQYYCLTERFPNEAVLQMWGDGENAPEWCEWDGDMWVPTSHKVLAFWPTPTHSAASTYRTAQPALLGEAPPVDSTLAELKALAQTELLEELAFAEQILVQQKEGRAAKLLARLYKFLQTSAFAIVADRNNLLAKSHAAAPASPWVAVADRLPVDEIDNHDNPFGTTLYLVARPAAAYVSAIALGYRYDGNWFIVQGNGGDEADFVDNTVTHWCELPAAPTQEGKETSHE